MTLGHMTCHDTNRGFCNTKARGTPAYMHHCLWAFFLTSVSWNDLIVNQWYAPSIPRATDSENMTRQRTTRRPEMRLSSMDLSQPLGDSERNKPCVTDVWTQGALLLTTIDTNHPPKRETDLLCPQKKNCSPTPWVPHTHASHGHQGAREAYTVLTWRKIL